MVLATVTSKGQTTIPKEIRDHLQLQTGDEIAFCIQDGNVVIKALKDDVRSLKGSLKQYATRPVALEEMDQAIRRRSK